jgi:hypothetical protein
MYAAMKLKIHENRKYVCYVACGHGYPGKPEINANKMQEEEKYKRQQKPNTRGAMSWKQGVKALA